VHATPLQRHDDATMASSYPSTTVLLRDPPARRRRGTAYLILGVATIALFVVALLIARSLLNNSSASVNTPSLVGEAYGDAQATLQAQGLVLGKVTQQYTGKNDKGEVIAQQPPAGILDKKGAAVSLVISAGVQYVNVPAGLVGLEQSQAETALTANGFKIGQIISRNSGLPAGQVLATNPVSGQPAPAGSKIDLVVSNAKTKVPDVTMQDPDVATAILQQDGFSNILQKRAAVYSKKNDGLIVSQTPAAGTFATPDEQIIIYIDEKPPPPTNSPSPTTSPTITPSPGISTTPSITPSP
jgi:serine/threonine-protein kinase